VGTTLVQCAPRPLDVAGARALGYFTFIPPSGAAAAVSCVTYAATAHFGIAMDPAAVTEPELFRTCLVAGLNELKEAVA
jgi:diacylglycerol O-acyltransferase